MSVWWCAIHTVHTSYAELKHRRVVAQGWQALGDLSNLARLVPGHRGDFDRIIQIIGDVWYAQDTLWRTKDREPGRAPGVLWNLLNLRRGDLVVGIEGARVRGICELYADARDLYRYQPHWEYAQTLFDVDWTDWDSQVLGPAPAAPRQSVHGIKQLQHASASVSAAWAKR